MRQAIAALVCGTATLALAPAAARAQDERDPYAACAAIEGAESRLACFDRTYASENARRASAAQAEEEEREEQFGLTATQRREQALAAGEQPEAADAEDAFAVTSAVVEVFSDAARRQVVLLANGQVWRETSNSSMRRRVRNGWEATVSSSMTGGYRMRFSGQSGFLGVARLR